MASWHLEELENRLNIIGWKVISRLEGNDYKISGSWQIQRNSIIQIDFSGFDDMVTLPMEKSYGCSIRDTSIELYFSKKGKSWTNGLNEFISKLNERK